MTDDLYRLETTLRYYEKAFGEGFAPTPNLLRRAADAIASLRKQLAEALIERDDYKQTAWELNNDCTRLRWEARELREALRGIKEWWRKDGSVGGASLVINEAIDVLAKCSGEAK